MESLPGLVIIIAWLAVVIWGIARLLSQAKREKNWKTVGAIAVSAATVAGPLLFFSTDHVVFGGHTIGIGAILMLISGVVIGFYAYTGDMTELF